MFKGKNMWGIVKHSIWTLAETMNPLILFDKIKGLIAKCKKQIDFN